MLKLGEWGILRPKISMFELFLKSFYQTYLKINLMKGIKEYVFLKKIILPKIG